MVRIGVIVIKKKNENDIIQLKCYVVPWKLNGFSVVLDANKADAFQGVDEMSNERLAHDATSLDIDENNIMTGDN